MEWSSLIENLWSAKLSLPSPSRRCEVLELAVDLVQIKGLGIKFAVAYLSPADNASGSLLGGLRGVHQPVVKPRNRFAAARLSLLAGL